ncbi:MAG: cupin, partial [Nocardioides sp.]
LEDRGALADELARRLEQVADDVRRLDATSAVEAEVRRFLTGRGSRLDGGLRDVLDASEIDDSTLLRRRPGHPCVLLPHGDRLEVLLGDRSLDVPVRLEPALEEIRARTELRPADLHEQLDPESRLVLCRRLIREGLLGVVR